MAAVVQARDRPWLCRFDQSIDAIPPLCHQHIVGILETLRHLDAPADILPDPARQFLCSHLTGSIAVGADDNPADELHLVLGFPDIAELLVIARIDLAIDQLHGCAIGYRHGTLVPALDEGEGVHLPLADDHIIVGLDVVDVPECGWRSVAGEALATRPAQLFCVTFPAIFVWENNDIDI